MITKSSEPRPIGADDRDLAPGQQVGEYVIEGKLGQGGFGTVFLASHPVIGKQVAIKVLKRQYSAQEEMVSRFVAEARAVNQIRNRYIIDIFNFNTLDDGRHYYVMEYLEGASLDDHLAQRGRMSLEEAIPILRAIARALDAAHAKGIAHRDLKPENVFLATESDGTVYPKLLDFGIAKLLHADDNARHKTRTGAPLGTPYYMSPEQCRGKDVDHRTDIYAFGAVTFKLLTGVVPFDGDDYMEILIKQMNDPVPELARFAPELPPSIHQVIAWMMAKDPAGRPPNVVAGVRALEDAAAAAGVAVPVWTAPMGAVPVAGRTPASLPPVMSGPPSSSELAAAATVDAESLRGFTPPAPLLTTGPTAPSAPPRRRVWAFVAAATAPLVAVAIGFVVLNREQAPDGSPERSVLAQKSGGGAIQPTTTAPSGGPVQTEPVITLPSRVTVTLRGLPAGTVVRDPDGHTIATADGGDTAVELPAGSTPVKLGLRHPTRGDATLEVTPSASVALAAPALVRGASPRKAAKPHLGKKPPETNRNADQGPGGTDALEPPPEFK